jgi:hypothetical protein
MSERWGTMFVSRAEARELVRGIPNLRDEIAKTIFGRRWQMDRKDVNSMFDWYEGKPQNMDRSRISIRSSIKDADAVIALLASMVEKP